ncbi:bifunctional diaminohydroxyphosphoribosylaminopyrimidine deaminase / 5-amino-6-(5-phosphoribosylamino)uracil reductase RibD [Thermosynechococcus sp. NK55a]|jgi:diaminohydroxyphosphoribosylaminopyrimidine deaminase/5-amino-6-(5-phosphoribosylamino)uracil reductase|uniref:bifunctional diaminohydroxyphosphoribosylaminopyrimidine deaminase/5-amino-6-(5-phosphoribosylamino)uracil reductase RibD n=1 Tax=unclassified Thermosynechococcus TaxID=2622553 RepID=UPI0003D91F08|nr:MULTISPECIES: bifunctional diaminohydroxyphosphoribosylaminopyrimidine deaminase/5-amino-6-(5-phosphoribosylamino)uracil reductase RibD [unclassified Thermosynechococcus]AHB88775.1 bifunctional diaminohydroxyphosphoribosylaminopyrimidine deaminase / 5-amino-6-(5-phosphoribosylamino)uracil reductase RibD [Thermosynechococcus sp. NK55a]HIK23998.1 bifunctional diaminohydroxyphosphoribosylaminopyrimidine deaminase/5-amino-6-(5-phosphoribosylamino)uracil reductase RibD [Thermosynechococcus sp. M374
MRSAPVVEEIATIDAQYMGRCLELAARAKGRTAPNPLVGCVIVAEGRVIGEGFHPKAGEPHAEVFALRSVSESDRPLLSKATLYVNLEPCNHYGRTPPCTEAIVAAGIPKVVVGMIDPNPQVAGAGVERLRAAGIEVTVGVREADCQRLNEAFVHRVRYQRPFGIFKYAMTLDGKIASRAGHSLWVSGEAARAMVHQLRSECDAVIVGGNTVRLDNPLLTSRHEHNPLRVVMSRTLDLPRDASLWETTTAATLVVTSASPQHPLIPQLQAQGVEVVHQEPLTPTAVMALLYQRGIMTVLWECGGSLAAAAIAEGMVQKVWAFIAPKIIGGFDAPAPVADLGLTKMHEALCLEDVTWQAVGEDILVVGYLPSRPPVPSLQ